MKHLHLFETSAEYAAVKESLEKPYIVSIKDNEEDRRFIRK